MHVDRERFQEILDKSDVTLDELEEVFPGIKEQLQQEGETNPTIVLDGGTFFSELAETDFQRALMDDIKPTPGDLSMRQAREKQEQIKQEAKELSKSLKAVDKLRSEREDDALKLGKTLVDAAVAAGVNPRVARDSVALWVVQQKRLAEEVSKKRVAEGGEAVTPTQLLEESLPEGMTVKDLVVDEGRLALSGQATSERLKMFVGRKGFKERFDKETSRGTMMFDSYSLAIKMGSEGKSSEEIRQSTGWFIGNDGAPRLEISDKNSSVIATPTFMGPVGRNMAVDPSQKKQYTTLGDVLKHDVLFEYYPQLKNIPIFTDDLGPNIAGQVEYYIDADGNKQKRIVLSDDLDPADMRSTLLHEVQHTIQNEETFAIGGSPAEFRGTAYQEMFESDFLVRLSALARGPKFDLALTGGPQSSTAIEVKRQLTRMYKLIRESRNENAFGDPDTAKKLYSDALAAEREARRLYLSLTVPALQIPETQKQYERYVKELVMLAEQAPKREPGGSQSTSRRYETLYYRRLAGEVEARLVQERSELSEGEIAATPPSTSEDVSPFHLIFKFPDGRIAEPPPGGFSKTDFPAIDEDVSPGGGATSVFSQTMTLESSGIPAPMQSVSGGGLYDDSAFLKWQPPKTKDGVFKGAPEWVKNARDVRKLRDLLHQLVKEGEAGRYWYENSAREVLRIVGNDVALAEKLLQLIAIYSPRADIWSNLVKATKAFEHWRNGKPAETLKFGFEKQNEKARAVLYDNVDFEGRKTNSFYLNLLYEINATRPAEVAALNLDPDVLNAISGVATIDLWMYRAFGYANEQGGNDKQGKYSFSENMTRRITAELNANRPPGSPPYLPMQVQAMIWTAMKTRYEMAEVKKKTNERSAKQGLLYEETKTDAQGKTRTIMVYGKTAAEKRQHLQNWRAEALKPKSDIVKAEADIAARDFSDDIVRMTETVTWESLPAKDLQLPINDAPDPVIREFTKDSRALIVDPTGQDLLARLLGVVFFHGRASYGGFDGGVANNVLSSLVPLKPPGPDFSVDQVRLYTRAIQYIFKQEAVPWFRLENATPNKAFRERTLFKVVSDSGRTLRKFETQEEAEKYAATKPGATVQGSELAAAWTFRFKNGLTRQKRQELMDALGKIHPDLGFTQLDDRSVVVVNYRDPSKGNLPSVGTDDALDAAFEKMAQSLKVETTERAFVQGEYGDVHDWQKDVQGEGIVKRHFAGQPALESWVRDRRARFEELLARYDQAGIESTIEALVQSGIPVEGALRGRGLSGLDGRHRQGATHDVRYGRERATPDSVSVVGVHFGKTPRLAYDSRRYGGGKPGAEARRIAGHPLLGSRTYFYVDTGHGIVPEVGVGSELHVAQLDNIYDTKADPQGLVKRYGNDPNRMELEIVKAGFDGYLIPRAFRLETTEDPTQTMGSAVLIGPQHKTVPVDYQGTFEGSMGVQPAGTEEQTKRAQAEGFTLSNSDRAAGRLLVEVDVNALDGELSKAEGYVGPQGEGGIEGRYEQFERFLDKEPILTESGRDVGRGPGGSFEGAAIEAPSLRVVQGKLVLENGRHRFAVLRDRGARVFVAVSGREMLKPSSPLDRVVPSRVKSVDPTEGTLGEFDRRTFQIIIGKKHTAATLTHELTHLHFEQLISLYKKGDLNEQQIADLETLVTQTGDFKSLDEYINAPFDERHRKVHEQVAHKFEVYLRKGEAPTPGLRKLFGRMLKWFKRTYADMRRISENYQAQFGVPLPALTEDVKLVFDRWFASEEEIDIRNRELMLGRLLLNQDLDPLDKLFLEELIFEHELTAKEKLRRVFMRELGQLRRLRNREFRKLQREHKKERTRVESEERAALLRESKLARMLHFLSTGELLDAEGNVIDTFAPQKVAHAESELEAAMSLQDDVKQELAPRQAEAVAAEQRALQRIEQLKKAIAELKESRVLVSKEVQVQKKSGQPDADLLAQNETVLAEYTKQIEENEKELNEQRKNRNDARAEQKQFERELKEAEALVNKAITLVESMEKLGAAGKSGTKMFLTSDERVPERYRTTDPKAAMVVDVEGFAREQGFVSASQMFDALRVELVGAKQATSEFITSETKSAPKRNLAKEALQDMVDERADRRMLAEMPHLADPEQMQNEIDNAMTTEALLRLRAAEVNLLEQRMPAERELLATAKQVAREVVGKLKLSELFGRQNAIRKFLQAAQRAELEASKGVVRVKQEDGTKTTEVRRGDIEKVNQLKRTALMQRALAAEALARRNQIVKQQAKLEKQLRYSANNKRETRLAQTYGGPFVESARWILNLMGVDVGSGLRESNPDTWRPWDKMADDDPAKAELQLALDDADLILAEHGELREQSVEQAVETLFFVEGLVMRGKQLQNLSHAEREATVQELIDELKRRVQQERAPRRQKKPKTWWAKAWAGLRKWRSSTQRLEQTLYAMDGDSFGMLSQLLFSPVRDAEDTVELTYAKVAAKLVDLLKPVRDNVGSSKELHEAITGDMGEDGKPLLQDPDQDGPHVFQGGKLDILGVLLHSGNESNLKRLLLGYGWANYDEDGNVDTTRFWEQVSRWEEAGVITKEDWAFVQGVWDVYESDLLPMTQQAHMEMLGREMEIVQKGGAEMERRGLAGGYVPASPEPTTRTVKGQTQAQENLLGFMRMIPAVQKGHTLKRVQQPQPDPLDINPLNQLVHFRQQIIFAVMGPVHRRVAHALRNNEVAELLEQLNPDMYQNLLKHWLEAATNLSSTMVDARSNDLLSGLDYILKIRSNYGTAAMFANVVNSLQGVTGLILARARVKAKHMAFAMGDAMRSDGMKRAEIYELSDFMKVRHRLGVSAFELQQDIVGLVKGEGPLKLAKLKRWIAKNTYIAQEAIQFPVDLIVWRGAFDEALAAGMEQEQAVAAADSAVRQTQSDTAVISMARGEKGNTFSKLFTQFASWFLALGSLSASPLRRATLEDRALREQDANLARRAASMGATIAFSKEAIAGFLSLYVGELIMDQFTEKEDDEPVVDFAGSLYQTALAIPRAFGPVSTAASTFVASLSGAEPYQQRMPAPAPVAIMGQLARRVRELYDGDELEKADFADLVETISMAFGIPVQVVSQRLRRGFNILDEDDVEPSMRGLITGRR
ncbi:MAG: DUF7178 family protein [Ilumatobacteraceae bacterium]